MTNISWFCLGALVPSMLLAAIILIGVADYLVGAAVTSYAAAARARFATLLSSVRVARARKPAPAFAPRLSHA